MGDKKTEEKKESFWETKGWILIYGVAGCLILTLIIVGTYTSTLKEIADKDYLARITPQERQEMFARQEADRIQAEKQSEELWKPLIDFMWFPIPNFIIWGVVILAYWWGREKRW